MCYIRFLYFERIQVLLHSVSPRAKQHRSETQIIIHDVGKQLNQHSLLVILV